MQVVLHVILLFQIPRIPEKGDISEGKLKWIPQNLDWIIALIIDEQSMNSSGNLCMMEYHSRFAAYRGKKDDQFWGGIPLIIMVGDDFQLPSAEKGFCMCSECYGRKRHKTTTWRPRISE